jgi:hypothetical protein
VFIFLVVTTIFLVDIYMYIENLGLFKNKLMFDRGIIIFTRRCFITLVFLIIFCRFMYLARSNYSQRYNEFKMGIIGYFLVSQTINISCAVLCFFNNVLAKEKPGSNPQISYEFKSYFIYMSGIVLNLAVVVFKKEKDILVSFSKLDGTEELKTEWHKSFYSRILQSNSLSSHDDTDFGSGLTCNDNR